VRLTLLLVSLLCLVPAGAAADGPDSIHFLVPGGAGGGWDTTAREVGRALAGAGLVDAVSYENMSGASGGKGVSHMIETAAQNTHVLMINSTPIIARSLIPAYGQSWRELTPIAAVIGDYGAVIVRSDARWTGFDDLLRELRVAPRAITFAGGSTRGGLDHLIVASVFRETGLDPMEARYVPYDAGGKALLALLSGEVDAMSATVGDAISAARDGNVRILAVAAPERLDQLPDVPTLRELGYPVELLNWRGFFAVPGLPDADRLAFVSVLEAMRGHPGWQTAIQRHGWVEKFMAGDEFLQYLERQEVFIGELMSELGFIGTGP
jgi:putative tricarboxylic transport membrane protein